MLKCQRGILVMILKWIYVGISFLVMWRIWRILLVQIMFANGLGDLCSIPGRTIPKTCLTLIIIRYGSRIKWSNPGKEVAPSPTPWYSRYRKGSIRVALTTVANFILLTFMLILTRVPSIDRINLFENAIGLCAKNKKKIP